MKKIYLFSVILIIIAGAIFVPTFILNPKLFQKAPETPLKIGQNEQSTWDLHEEEVAFLDKIGLTKGDYEISGFSGLPLSENSQESPIAIMIENHGLAQPHQRGLSLAEIVYETYAEGGITRFMAIITSKSPQKVGPVRSLRPYFLDWAKEHTHTLIHAGGSDEALENLAVSGLIDIDEDEEDDTFLFRDTDIEKPHNLFANMEVIRSTLPSPIHDWKNMPFQFTDNKTGNEATSIKIAFGEPYNAQFIYDEDTNSYTRYQREHVHRDQLNNKPIKPTNIIVQETSMEVIDDIGRLDIETNGTGKILVFAGGSVKTGTWKKNGGITKYTDNNGVPITLNRGQTWIAVIDTLDKITWN